MHNNNHIHPRFSIITVTYNAEKALEETIQSIISQTYKDIEYIIVDGGSKDRTLSIIEKYKSHIAKVVSEPDKGLYDAMNKGLKMATGDYVCFLNAGDSLHEDETVTMMVKSIEKNQFPDVIYGETAIVDSKRHFLHMRRLSAPAKLNWKSFKNGMLVCHQAFFAKREIAIDELYNLKYRFSADFDWCIRVMKRAKSFHNSEITIVDYLNEGMTTQNHRASLLERFNIMCKHYGIISTILQHIWFMIRVIIK